MACRAPTAHIPEKALKERGAAVDVDGLARDRCGLLRAEKERGAGDFVGSLSAALQNRFEKTGELFFGADAELRSERVAQFLGHARLGDRSGTDGVYAHAFAGSFGGGDTRQAEH